MFFFKKHSKKNVELIGGDMDGTMITVQETLPELEFISSIYPPGQELSGNLNEINIKKETIHKTKPIKTIKIIYKKWKIKGNTLLYRFDRYDKGN